MYCLCVVAADTASLPRLAKHIALFFCHDANTTSANKEQTILVHMITSFSAVGRADGCEDPGYTDYLCVRSKCAM